jgi:hypothetical protein
VLLRLALFPVWFAGQVAANDSYKLLLADDHGELTVLSSSRLLRDPVRADCCCTALCPHSTGQLAANGSYKRLLANRRPASTLVYSFVACALTTKTARPASPCLVFLAGQLAANDSYKRLLADDLGELTVPKRLMAGACALPQTVEPPCPLTRCFACAALPCLVSRAVQLAAND